VIDYGRFRMGLLRVNDVRLTFGTSHPLLDGVSLQVEPGERIGLLGRNGSGKSTFMKLVAGTIAPDGGEIVRSGGARVALLPQDVPDYLPGTVYDVVSSGGAEDVELLRKYHELTQRISQKEPADVMDELAHVQHLIEASGAWHYHQRIESVIEKMELEGYAIFHELSAGLKRRVFLARALVNDPDLLLLDEPTNHLDIGTIIWLEDFLLKFGGTLMFVTHDRAFLQRLATRIVEIDRGKLLSFACDYRTFLERRQGLLEAEERAWQGFDKKLAKEEVWIRQGIRARRTRNEGRARALVQMRQERAMRQEQAGLSRLEIPEAERSGRMVVEAQEISFSWGNIHLVDGFSTTILRGDRVGIIGPNGAGKTTLLQLLLGRTEPQKGRVRLGAGVRVAYFDQLRAQLDENRTLRENIGNGNDMIPVGTGSRHVVGYLQDFLFSPEQTMAPVRSLSGGERNRLLLAKLFTTPSNVLVLDEPTNDLDAETLDLLEDKLLEYRGTILVVSHDRAFLNNVVTSTIVFEGNGRLREYVGGYDDWVRAARASITPVGTAAPKDQRQKREKPKQEKRKLSYKEARELEALPAAIGALEEEKGRIVATLNSPEFYASYDAAKTKSASDRLKALESELDAAYRRWEELEDLQAKLSLQSQA
jgi:ABC transport system ATP-binding/permease protein